MAANPSTRVGIDPGEADRSARSRLGDRRHDHADELAQGLRQVRGVGGREAGAIKGAIGGEEVGVAGAGGGGGGPRGGGGGGGWAAKRAGVGQLAASARDLAGLRFRRRGRAYRR